MQGPFLGTSHQQESVIPQQKAEGAHSHQVWELPVQVQELPFFGSGCPPPGTAGRSRLGQAPTAAPKAQAKTKTLCFILLLWQSSAATRGELSTVFTGNELPEAEILSRQDTTRHPSGTLRVRLCVAKHTEEKGQILVQLIYRERAKQPRRKITHLLFLRATG